MKIPVLTLGLMMAWTSSHAEEGERERGRPGGGGGHFLRGADSDGDGSVSFEEFSGLERLAGLPEEARRKLFARLDKNGDGSIRRDELPKPMHQDGHRPPLAMRQLDADGDGTVDFEEFLESPIVQKMPEERRRAFFERLDQNGDGKISPEDRPKGGPRDGRGGRHDFRGHFAKLDLNGDGVLDFDEFRKSPWVKQLGEDAQEDRFESLDANGDLKLDRSEISRGRPGMERGRGPRDGQQDRRPNRRPGPQERPHPDEGDPPMMDEGA